MQSFRILVAQLAALTLSCSVHAQNYAKEDLPRLPGAELLVEGYLPERYLLTTEDKTITLQQDAVGLSARPSISADGTIVAFVHAAPGENSRAPRAVLSIYSVQDGKWTDHPDFEGVGGSVAISPDGSKVACVTRDEELRPSDPPHFRFRVLDLATGRVTVILESRHWPMDLSWSPDGRRVAFDMYLSDHWPWSEIGAIYVADLKTGKISQIGLGQAPAWSPSGEWIAYISYVAGSDRDQASNLYGGRYYAIDDFKVRLMSPIGTRSRALRSFSSDVEPNLQPVWSPDSKQLLLTESRDADNGTFDVYLLDVANGKTRKKFKNVAPVFGWIEAK